MDVALLDSDTESSLKIDLSFNEQQSLIFNPQMSLQKDLDENVQISETLLDTFLAVNDEEVVVGHEGNHLEDLQQDDEYKPSPEKSNKKYNTRKRKVMANDSYIYDYKKKNNKKTPDANQKNAPKAVKKTTSRASAVTEATGEEEEEKESTNMRVTRRQARDKQHNNNNTETINKKRNNESENKNKKREKEDSSKESSGDEGNVPSEHDSWFDDKENDEEESDDADSDSNDDGDGDNEKGDEDDSEDDDEEGEEEEEERDKKINVKSENRNIAKQVQKPTVSKKVVKKKVMETPKSSTEDATKNKGKTISLASFVKSRGMVACKAPGCKNSINSDSKTLYCSKDCLDIYVRHVLSNLDTGRSGGSDDRLVVFERSSGKIVTGPMAPTEKTLAAWLSKHPTYEVMIAKKKPTAVVADKKDTKGIEKRDEIAQDIKMMAVKFLKKNADDDAVEVPKPAPTPTPPNPPPAAVAPNTSTAPKNNGKFDPIRISVRNVLRESLTRRANESEDVMVSGSEIKWLVMEVEEKLFTTHGGVNVPYKTKAKAIVAQLKNLSNKGFFRRLLFGQLQPCDLVQLSIDKIASKELSQWQDDISALDLMDDFEAVEEKKPVVKPTQFDIPTITMDTTKKHDSHLFDMNCKICTAKPAEEEQLKPQAVVTKQEVKPTSEASNVKEEPIQHKLTNISDNQSKSAQPYQKSRNDKKTLLPTPPSTTQQQKKHTPPKQKLQQQQQQQEKTKPTKATKLPEISPKAPLKPCQHPHKMDSDHAWCGSITDHDNNTVRLHVSLVSGNVGSQSNPKTNILIKELPQRLDMKGKMNMDSLCDVIQNIKKAGTFNKDVAVLCTKTCTPDDHKAYMALYNSLNSKNKCAVINVNDNNVDDNSGKKSILGFYIFPLSPHLMPPPVFLPFDGPGLPIGREELLLAVLIKSSPYHTNIESQEGVQEDEEEEEDNGVELGEEENRIIYNNIKTNKKMAANNNNDNNRNNNFLNKDNVSKAEQVYDPFSPLTTSSRPKKHTKTEPSKERSGSNDRDSIRSDHNRDSIRSDHNRDSIRSDHNRDSIDKNKNNTNNSNNNRENNRNNKESISSTIDSIASASEVSDSLKQAMIKTLTDVSFATKYEDQQALLQELSRRINEQKMMLSKEEMERSRGGYAGGSGGREDIISEKVLSGSVDDNKPKKYSFQVKSVKKPSAFKPETPTITVTSNTTADATITATSAPIDTTVALLPNKPLQALLSNVNVSQLLSGDALVKIKEIIYNVSNTKNIPQNPATNEICTNDSNTFDNNNNNNLMQLPNQQSPFFPPNMPQMNFSMFNGPPPMRLTMPPFTPFTHQPHRRQPLLDSPWKNNFYSNNQANNTMNIDNKDDNMGAVNKSNQQVIEGGLKFGQELFNQKKPLLSTPLHNEGKVWKPLGRNNDLSDASSKPTNTSGRVEGGRVGKDNKEGDRRKESEKPREKDKKNEGDSRSDRRNVKTSDHRNNDLNRKSDKEPDARNNSRKNDKVSDGGRKEDKDINKKDDKDSSRRVDRDSNKKEDRDSSRRDDRDNRKNGRDNSRKDDRDSSRKDERDSSIRDDRDSSRRDDRDSSKRDRRRSRSRDRSRRDDDEMRRKRRRRDDEKDDKKDKRKDESDDEIQFLGIDKPEKSDNKEQNKKTESSSKPSATSSSVNQSNDSKSSSQSKRSRSRERRRRSRSSEHRRSRDRRRSRSRDKRSRSRDRRSRSRGRRSRSRERKSRSRERRLNRNRNDDVVEDEEDRGRKRGRSPRLASSKINLSSLPNNLSNIFPSLAKFVRGDDVTSNINEHSSSDRHNERSSRPERDSRDDRDSRGKKSESIPSLLDSMDPNLIPEKFKKGDQGGRRGLLGDYPPKRGEEGPDNNPPHDDGPINQPPHPSMMMDNMPPFPAPFPMQPFNSRFFIPPRFYPPMQPFPRPFRPPFHPARPSHVRFRPDFFHRNQAPNVKKGEDEEGKVEEMGEVQNNSVNNDDVAVAKKD